MLNDYMVHGATVVIQKQKSDSIAKKDCKIGCSNCQA